MSGASWLGWVAVVVMGGYLLGSLPTGYLVGRAVKGIDIRQYGSGSTGATNVLRTLGKGPALAVFLIDVFKGALAIALAQWIYTLPMVTVPPGVSPEGWVAWGQTLAGLAALVGHSRSVWLGFSGGKSVASGLGVLCALYWPSALGALLVFGTMLAIFRIVSLGSMAAAIAVSVLMVALRQPLPFQLFGVAAAVYVIMRHRTNIQRLLVGTEPKIGQKLEQPEPESGS